MGFNESRYGIFGGLKNDIHSWESSHNHNSWEKAKGDFVGKWVSVLNKTGEKRGKTEINISPNQISGIVNVAETSGRVRTS